MKKNLLLTFSLWIYPQFTNELKRFLRIMKIAMVFLLVLIFQISATNIYSQNAVVNLSKSNLSVEEFITEVENQTNYLFLYNEKDIDLHQRVVVKNLNKPVIEVLKEAFSESDIVYSFSEDYISLRKSSLSIQQQEGRKRVSGTVVGVDGDPIIGANVIEKGTTNSVVTDTDGKFNISVTPNSILQISYIGFISQEIRIDNQATLKLLYAKMR